MIRIASSPDKTAISQKKIGPKGRLTRTSVHEKARKGEIISNMPVAMMIFKDKPLYLCSSGTR